jgi:hypothetical protein
MAAHVEQDQHIVLVGAGLDGIDPIDRLGHLVELATTARDLGTSASCTASSASAKSP